jgi:hypothetical protein
MLTFELLKNRPRRFLAMTSLTLEEFHSLVPIFAEEYVATRSLTHTRAGQPRQRKAGGGNIPRLTTLEDKLLFILIYQKTYPLQTAHGLQFGLSQSQTNEWIHTLMPLLDKALIRLKHMPPRDPKSFKESLDVALPLDFMIDGTERRKQRPKNAKKQAEAYSGKKKRTPIKTSL